MKKCPQCSRTYPDDTLAFCLEDGALLSASYSPQATNAPTVAINADEVPTVVAREIPTVGAAKEIPTVAAVSRPTEEIEKRGVRWYIYLFGFIVSTIIYFGLSFLYFWFYRVIDSVFESNATSSGVYTYLLAEIVSETIISLFIFGILAFIFGFIWSKARWKWGLIIVVPDFLMSLRSVIIYIVLFSSKDNDTSSKYGVSLSGLIGIIITEIVSFLLILLFACLCSYLGSRLSQKNL
ncbi:MAG: hypothetical protein ABWZ66_06280 [Pyrinomonadaceae bacterium]